MFRRLITLLVGLLAILTLASPALAKAGATTKLDSLPGQWQASQTYRLGYTIRMDGVEPYRADRTEIVANSIDGRTNLVFAGVADGTPGHYTARVMFPAVGPYQWKVTQGSFFPPYDLGTISVVAAATSSGSSLRAAPASDPFRDAAPFVAAGALGLAALIAARRQRPRALRTTYTPALTCEAPLRSSAPRGFAGLPTPTAPPGLISI